MIRIKIDVKKLDKSAFFAGKNGALYADITLMENRGGPDRFGNDYMVVQDLGKERRLAGEKGAILGNGKAYVHGKPAQAHQPEQDTYSAGQPMQRAAEQNVDEDVPF